MNTVLIIGAKSDIAKALAREYANHGYDLYLASRNTEELSGLKSDIEIRTGQKVKLCEFDIIDFATHENFYNSLKPKPLGIIVVTGYMADQKKCENDFTKTLNTINVNYTGAISILNIVANNMEKERHGFIVGISSVAGDRGRKSNYIYGSSKAGFSTYLSGLRNRMFDSGVHVLTVKPGFVATKMTKGLDLPAKLTTQPEEVAKDIFIAQQKKKNILYTKWIWQYIMLIIQHLPESIFKKMTI